MAADVWKVKDMFGRVYIYETEKLFTRRYRTSVGEYQERLAWQAQNPNGGAWTPHPPEGFRVENDVWVPCEVDKEEMKAYLEKREIRRLKAEARRRGYRRY